MQNRLPSMTGLRAFEASARHLSFTRASIELNLTQSAVSHQIRNLEELIGVRLFDRTGNDISLTDAGQDYLAATRSVLTELQTATDRVTWRRHDDVLNLASLGTFAIKCLLPNLHDFIAKNPADRLSVRTLVPFATSRADDFDVSIQYGRDGDWPGFASARLTSEEIFPVCSPRLVEAQDGLRDPEDLARFTIVRTTSPLILRDDWPLWLRKAGIADIEFPREITCDLLYPSYQIAIEGLGVALGRGPVVRGDIAAGRLVEPFTVRLPSPLGYHLVYRQHLEELPKVQRFRSWACEFLSHRLNDPDSGSRPDTALKYEAAIKS